MPDRPDPQTPQALAPPGSLAIEVLGRVKAKIDGQSADTLAAQPKRFGLLLYLALARPNLVRRDTLLSIFWPELEENGARAALSQALSVLRRIVGDNRIETRGTAEVGLSRQGFTCDVALFEAAADAGDLAAAATLYQGPLLPGLVVPGAPEFEHWRDSERERLRRRYVSVLEKLAERTETAEGLEPARAWWERLTRLEPLNERYAAGLIRSLVASGKRDIALAEAEALRQRLNEELGVRPGPELLAAIDLARVGLSRADGRSASNASPSRSLAASASAKLPHRRTSVLAVALGALGLGVAAWLATRPRTGPETNGPILVTVLVDRTGQPALRGLGELAAGWITDGLVRQGGMQIVDPAAAVVLSQRLPGPTSPESLVHLGQRLHLTQIVTGAIEKVLDSIALSARVLNVRDGRVLGAVRVLSTTELASTSGIAELRERVVGLIAVSRNQTIRQLGGDLIAPPRLGAYNRFMVGLQLFQHSDSLALEPFLSAFRMDSNFVLTLVWARYAAANAGFRTTSDSLARVIAHVLAARGDRLSLYERLVLTTETPLADSNFQVYSSAVTSAAGLAPGSNFSYLLGQFQTRRMQYAQAARAYERVDSDGWLGSWAGMVWWAGTNAHMLGQFEQQLAMARKALSDNPADRGFREVEASALAALGRMTEVETSIAAAGPHGAWNVTWYAGVEAYDHGNRQAGLELLRRARRAGQERPQDVPPGFAAITSVYLGDWQEAERLAREPVLRATREGQAPYLKPVAELGAILAMMGRMDEARSLSRRLAIDSALAPHPAGVSSEFERVLGRAFIAAALGEKDSALALLEGVRSTAQYGYDGLIPGYRIFHSPFVDALRSDPRFLRIIGMR